MEVMILCEELIRERFMECQSVRKPKELSWEEEVFTEPLEIPSPVDL